MGSYAPSMCEQIQKIENKRQQKAAAEAEARGMRDAERSTDPPLFVR